MGDTRVKAKLAYAAWPSQVQYIYDRAMRINGWDELTTYVQIMIGNVWLPAMEVYSDEMDEHVLSLPCKKIIKERL